MLSECDRKGGNAITREKYKIYESVGGENGKQEQSATHKHLLSLSAKEERTDWAEMVVRDKSCGWQVRPTLD
jgi:hypothetical protein